jgi:hypothetical protein
MSFERLVIVDAAYDALSMLLRMNHISSPDSTSRQPLQSYGHPDPSCGSRRGGSADNNRSLPCEGRHVHWLHALAQNSACVRLDEQTGNNGAEDCFVERRRDWNEAATQLEAVYEMSPDMSRTLPVVSSFPDSSESLRVKRAYSIRGLCESRRGGSSSVIEPS